VRTSSGASGFSGFSGEPTFPQAQATAPAEDPASLGLATTVPTRPAGTTAVPAAAGGGSAPWDSQDSQEDGPAPRAARPRPLRPEYAALRALVDLRDRQLQKARIQFGNRLDAVLRAADPAVQVQEEILRRYYEAFDELERLADRDIARLVATHPIYDELARVRGVGPGLAAKLLALIGDISWFDTVSKLWRFAGYAVIDGKAERLVRGERAHFSTRLKATCYLVGVSMLRSSSPYRVIYDHARARYAQTRPEWTPMHQHMAALRKMVKIFLSHLWERWRRRVGLPVRLEYVHEYLGHTTRYLPEEFGWQASQASRPARTVRAPRTARATPPS
jgi:hypothetical protein